MGVPARNYTCSRIVALAHASRACRVVIA